MMISARHQLGISTAAVALTLLCLSGSASGAAPDTSAWECESCPFQTGYSGDYTVGITTVTDDAAHFGSGNGYDESGLYGNLDGEGSNIGESYRMLWSIEDLGLDSRYVALEGGSPGRYGYEFTWRDLPYRLFDTTDTVFRQTGDGVLSLPSDWVRAPTTSAMPGLASSLTGTRIGSDRRVIGLGGEINAGAGFSLFATYRRQENDGSDFSAGAGFTSAAQLPRPFDYETDEVELGLRYTVDNGYLSLGWYGSFFQPESVGFTWDNPFSVIAGAETSINAQPPENSFQQVNLSGNYRFNGWDTVAAFSAAFGRAEQDETYLAYTSNPNIVSDPLPRSNLDGEVETTNFALTLTARPHPKFRARLGYRYDERDNQTPVHEYSRVIVDSFTSGEAETNTPYSFERTRLDLRGDLDLIGGLRLSGGYESRELDRSLQEVAGQDEDTGWVQVRWRPGAYLDITARGGTANREIDNYDTTAAQELGQNPLLRKYNMAYRYREFGELTLAAMHPELPLSGSLTVVAADDSYEQSQLGLVGSDDLRAAADLNWSFSDKGSVYVNAGYQEIDSSQTGSEGFGAPDWHARNEDEFKTFGGGLRLEDISDRIDLQFDYTHAEGTGSITLNSGTGAFERFPDIESDLDALRARMTYRKSDRLEVSATVRLEIFDSDDWALQGVDPDTVPTLLAMGADPYDYDVLLFSLGFRYTLGRKDPEQTR